MTPSIINRIAKYLIPKDINGWVTLIASLLTIAMIILRMYDRFTITKLKNQVKNVTEYSEALQEINRSNAAIYFTDAKNMRMFMAKHDSIITNELNSIKIKASRVERYNYNTTKTIISIVGERLERKDPASSHQTFYKTITDGQYLYISADVRVLCDSCNIHQVFLDNLGVQLNDTLYQIEYQGKREKKAKWLFGGIRVGRREIKDTTYNKNPYSYITLKRTVKLMK